MLTPKQIGNLERVGFKFFVNVFVYDVGPIYIEVSKEGKYFIKGDIDKAKEEQIAAFMSKFGIEKRDEISKSKATIKDILLRNNFEYNEKLNACVQKFKTHLVLVNDAGIVNILYYESFKEREMKTHKERIERWKKRFYDMGINVGGLKFL